MQDDTFSLHSQYAESSRIKERDAMETRAMYRGGDRSMEVYDWVLHDCYFYADVLHTSLCWGGGIVYFFMGLGQYYDGHAWHMGCAKEP